MQYPMMRLFSAVVSCALILLSSAVLADPPPLRTMLADPRALASWLASHDPVVAAAHDRADSAGSLADQAKVFPNPQLSAELGNISLGKGNPDPNTGAIGPTSFTRTTHLSVGLSELIEIGNRAGDRGRGTHRRT